MSKEEIKNLLIEFVCEYDFTSWSNDKVYEKFSDLICKRFADLEAKLAEKDSAEQSTYQNVLELTRMCTEKDKQIEQLKEWTDGTIIAKWTDAENKIKKLEDELTGRKKLCDLRYNQLKQQHQDKISFAVEQLEKVKQNILSNITFGIESVAIMNSIDNQIKQLKEIE